MSRSHRGSRRQPETAVLIIAAIVILAGVAVWLAYRSSPAVRDWVSETGLISSVSLPGTQWSWERSDFANGSSIQGPGGEAFVLSFDDDGYFTSTTDCNSAFGTFSAIGERLTIGPAASTKMWCGPDSLETEYLQQLERAASFSVVGSELRIELANDSGRMIFLRK